MDGVEMIDLVEVALKLERFFHIVLLGLSVVNFMYAELRHEGTSDDLSWNNWDASRG